MTETVEAPAEAQRYVGGGVLRKEDPELITGQARYIDDMTLPGMVWMAVVRSPFAHARITGFDADAAKGMPGVLAVWSGEDLASEWIGGLPCAWPVTVDMEEAAKDGAPLVHDELGTNRSYTWTLSNGEVDRVFSEAPVVVKERYYHPRLIPNAIEPRGVLVQPVASQGEYTIWSATQIPHVLRVT